MIFRILKTVGDNSSIEQFITDSYTALGLTNRQLPDVITYQVQSRTIYTRESYGDSILFSIKLPNGSSYAEVSYSLETSLSSPKLLVFGDPDCFYFMIVSLQSNFIVLCPTIHVNVHQRLKFATTTTSTVYSGSNVQIPVASASQFVAGSKATIMDMINKYTFTITNINYNTNVITADYIGYSFSSGSYVSYFPVPYILSCFPSDIYPYDVGALVLPPTLCKPLYRFLHTFGQNVYTTTVALFDYNYQYQFVTTKVLESGYVSSGSSTTLTDQTKNWNSNVFSGKYVVFTKTISSQVKYDSISKIVSNNSNTLTIMETDYSPTEGDSYAIADVFYRQIIESLYLKHTFDEITIVNAS